MKRITVLSMLLLVSLSLILNACKKEDTDTHAKVSFDNSVFIINEGPFQAGSGSLSIYKRDTDEVIHNVFENVNGFPLGNLAQSIHLYNDKAYIVVNNANKIEVANKDDLVSLGRIDDVNLPRYFLGINNTKAYASSWDNKVYVIDLNTNSVSGSIPTATGPEKMMLVGENVWVLNQGGFGLDSTITIINSTNDEVLQTLVVGDKPTGIVLDKDGMVWVMCSGNGWNSLRSLDDTKAELVCIHPQNYSIIKKIYFPESDAHPEKLVIDNDGETVYYNYPGGLYAQDLNKETLELRVVLTSEAMYYGLGYDTVSGNLFVTDPLDYVQNGKVYIINPLGEEILKSFDAGVIPAEFYFN